MRRDFAVAGTLVGMSLLMMVYFAMEGGPRPMVPLGAQGSTSCPDNANRTHERHRGAPVRMVNQHQPTVALCFFGLIKSVDEELVATVNASILHPLLLEGYTVDVFLHTYRATEYVNKFNDESSDHRFNQTASVEEMRRLFVDMRVHFDELEDADRHFPLQEHLQAGDPWPFHPQESLKFFLRQQYSLLRVTEMWSGVPLVNASSQLMDRRCGGAPMRHAIVSRYDGVIYLRPDLYMLSRLSLDAFEATVGASRLRESARQARHAQEPFSCDGDAVQHPWIQWDGQRRHIGAPTPMSIAATSNVRTGALHIAVPTFEWGGMHDRIAFGGPEVMFLYGARGLGLQTYIGQLNRAPHAERYLRDYLCAIGAIVHIAPLWSARRRVNGQLEDDGAKLLRLQVYGKRVGIWSKWQLQQSLDRYGRGLKKSCRFASMYAYEPFAPDEIPTRRTMFKRG